MSAVMRSMLGVESSGRISAGGGIDEYTRYEDAVLQTCRYGYRDVFLYSVS